MIYSNQYKIIANDKKGFDLELLEAPSQSYLYNKSIKREELEEIISALEEQCDNPEKYGYIIEYF